MTKLEELAAAQNAAYDKLGVLRRAERDDVQRVVAEHAEAIAAARLDHVAAVMARKAEKERLAMESAADRLPYPVGMRFRRWKYVKPLDLVCGQWMERTDDVAVMEIFGPDSDLPNNVVGKPNVGDPALRVLKKDGAPGKRVIPWRNNMGWHKEGVDPNKKGEADGPAS